jgi:D-glycero-D-manno-heptose 1,7-bisphosphate phosphatase
VINVDKGHVCRPNDFEFVDGIFDLCRTFHRRGYLLVVVTNQGGIGRGYYSEQDFLALTDWMLAVFREQGIPIAKVYYCPFHP